ncbi:MAG: hypothetical protein ACPGPS_04830, partial [Rubripirellula sp.]
AGAVVGSGNCPQLVVRVALSGEDVGVVARVDAVGVELGEAGTSGVASAEPVNGGTGNPGELTVVVEGSVVPLVAPRAEAAGSMGRPARSTFCVRAWPASAKEGGTEGKLNPEPATPELSGFRTVITRELRAAFKTSSADSLPSSGITTGDESFGCCKSRGFASAERFLSPTLVRSATTQTANSYPHTSSAWVPTHGMPWLNDLMLDERASEKLCTSVV